MADAAQGVLGHKAHALGWATIAFTGGLSVSAHGLSTQSQMSMLRTGAGDKRGHETTQPATNDTTGHKAT
jgi:hypothetical protein